jgi:broad specificity phosphatase PhoE
MIQAVLAIGAAVLALASFPAGSAAQTDPWQLLRQPGHVVFMRHSDAPGSGGFGDPAGFRLEDCATQRNLSDEDRAHARRTGEAFRRNGVAFDRVLTSPWCRCKETAMLAMGKEAEEFAPLSNLVGRSEHRDVQVKALKAYLAGLDGNTRALFVTHGIVINALTGI